MTTLQAVELGVLGQLQVRQGGAPVPIPGAKPRAILTLLGLHGGSVVSADTLLELLWGADPPRTAVKALQTHISSLRRTLGDGFVLTEGTGWTLAGADVDALRYKAAARLGRDAAAAGDTSQAVAHFEEALTLWRGIPELPDGQRGSSEKTRWIEAHAALVEDRADALLVTGRAAEIIGELEAAVADAPLRERRWGQLMLALYRAGRQGEALAAYQRARSLLAEELGVDPGPDLRRMEAAIVAQDGALEIPVAHQASSVTRAVTFLLTDIEGSTAAWESDAGAMAVALARHDELVEQVVTSRGGRLIKTRGEGDATFSVFDRPSSAAAAAIELQEAITHEPWTLDVPMRVRVALHTGEVELRDGDYFGRAVNRAARLRSLALGGQILCSGATAELVIDSVPDDVVLADLGMRQLRNLARPEHVFELRLETADDIPHHVPTDEPVKRPELPAVLTGPGPFVGRGRELARLVSAWQTALGGGMGAVLISGEPGVGKTRLAGEWSCQAYEQEAIVLYGRCDEDLGAPYQPFAEALRSLTPCLGEIRLRGLRGVEALLPLIPGLTDLLPDVAAPTRADPDTERYALFDAVVALLEVASTSAPVVLILDDLHWAAKSTLLLLRHLLRFGERARVQIVGTYRSTDLDRSHPLAAMLADLHRDGTAERLQLSGLDENDVTTYVAEAGYDDEELARALASVTGGNPFFLIEALRHVDESGGVWDQSTLPQGVREAVSRRLSRLPVETNKALAAAAVVGSRFAVELVERVVDQDLVDAFDEACKAGIVVEEPGGHYRFNHALVRQSLLAELPSVRRMRLHQRIATTLENEPGADDELLADLAHHYFECAWAGNAAKAVEYCRRAADQAMARLAYEGAADLYDHALHALEEIDDELPDRDDQTAELLVARCEALLASGDMASATDAVAQLQHATLDSPRLAAWAACFDGQLSMLIHPERLDAVESAVGAAADKLAELGDAAGEAKAHTVRAGCLARLGRIGDSEIALDHALTAARRAREHRRVNAVLAGAPLAALWGPNPVPRAGGRCLDVVRLLRITTDSPAVEATSTRCQAVLEAFRGRAAAARRMIDSARRTVAELGLRHSLLEVEQFAGIVELVIDDPAAAEPHLRKAYNGFRRMGLDADTAETAALLGRTCLELGRDAEADGLCAESERLAGHALKASIAWRTLRAQLLSRHGDHDQARQMAEAAVSLAESTDLLVDHGDACLSLATVLSAAGAVAAGRAAAERAVDLYERKGAAALVDKARALLGSGLAATTPPPAPEVPSTELVNECTQVGERLIAAVNREAWHEVEQLFAPEVSVESRRKIVGFSTIQVTARQWPHEMRRYLKAGMVRFRHAFVAVRGERLALLRLEAATADPSPGAPRDEMLQVVGLDDEGRIDRQVWFDIDDIDDAVAELDATDARFAEELPRSPLENAATRLNDRMHELYVSSRWDELGALFANDIWVDDRRRVLRRESNDRATEVASIRAIADWSSVSASATPLAVRGNRLCLSNALFKERDAQTDAFVTEVLVITEVDADGLVVALISFDADDFDAAIAELDARYLAGEASAHARTWSVLTGGHAAVNRHELPPTTPDCVSIDYRRGATFAPGQMISYLRAGWDLDEEIRTYVEFVHRLTDLGAVYTHAGQGISGDGFDAEWRGVSLLTVDGDLVSRCEIFEEADLAAALTRFEQLSRSAPLLDNAATQVTELYASTFASRDWTAMAELLADDLVTDDRRRVVNAGIRHGGDVHIADTRAGAEVGAELITPSVVATRGERLTLCRVRTSNRGVRPGEFSAEMLGIVEIDADNRITATVAFDLDDIDAAFAELDARYFAGEAAAHAETWSLIAGTFASLNKRELDGVPATSPDYQIIDHRLVHTTIPATDVPALFRATYDVTPDLYMYIEAVHLLDDLGAVITQAAYGTSQEGFEAQWRMVQLLTVKGHLGKECELYDEGDLDAALARFEELHPQERHLENAASRTYDRLKASFAARDWDALRDIIADDIRTDDRRRLVNAAIRTGQEAAIAEASGFAEFGAKAIRSNVIATRGDRIILNRSELSARDPRLDEFDTEILDLIEIDVDERVIARLVFDVGDIGAAFEELDARYLAGEGASHAHTFSIIAEAYAALNRREIPAITQDWANSDHRKVTTIAPGDLIQYVRAAWELERDIFTRIEAVLRLNDRGVAVARISNGTSREGFDAEWRTIDLMTVEGDLISRFEMYDETDLDAAIARFDELTPPVWQLGNAATQAHERFWACFLARDWTATAEMVTPDHYTDDRRRVIGAGIRHGRELVMEDLRAAAGFGTMTVSADVIATRGARLALIHARYSDRDGRPEAFVVDVLHIVEIDTDERITAFVMFDPDDFGAAFAELDGRYLAGEAADHAQAWSVIARTYAAFNKHEVTETPPNWVHADHRRGSPFAASHLTAVSRAIASWDLTPDLNIHINAVHRLTDSGAVVTHTARGTSKEGFDAEWTMIEVLTIDDGQFKRCELFDEADLESALSQFDELTRPVPQVENAATRAATRLAACFASSDWATMAAVLADDCYSEDRRRVVNADLRGSAAIVESFRLAAAPGSPHAAAGAVAIRADRLALTRVRYSLSDDDPEAFSVDLLQIVEIGTDDRVTAMVTFETDELGAACEELETRFLAGEGAAHAPTWSAITRAYATLNRHEVPATTPDLIDTDHRSVARMRSGDLLAWLVAAMKDLSDLTVYPESMHRLTDLGAVVTHVTVGTSQEGFDAEWRLVGVLTLDGDLINNCEVFDEGDLDAALARFDELSRQTPRLENAAVRVAERFAACFVARDWDPATALLADDVAVDDRRRTVNAGMRQGRDAGIQDLQAAADVGLANITGTFIATRGERLTLTRTRHSGGDGRSDAFHNENLTLVEINADGKLCAVTIFDLDDADSAFAELEARYLVGEAADHAKLWSEITQSYAAMNRHEIPATMSDWGTIDHRVRETFEGIDLTSYTRSAWDLMPDIKTRIEAVHRLSDLGVVATHVAHGTSQDGFEAEWRMVVLLLKQGAGVNRCELFNEADISVALSQFDGLHSQPMRLENAATRVVERSHVYLATCDWPALADLLAEDMTNHDRRRLVGADSRRGRAVNLADLKVIADVGTNHITSTVIAIRGDHLMLDRARYAGEGQSPAGVEIEVLRVIEIDTDNRVAACVVFDPADADAAFTELDARYRDGEAASHAHTWSVITTVCAALNRRELPETMPGWVNLDHRRGGSFAPGDMSANIRATWDQTPDIGFHVASVHRLTDSGAVITGAANGTSLEGFGAEWRQIDLLVVEDGLLSRCEMFDEADLDTALARFDELSRQVPKLDSPATRISKQLSDAYNRRDTDEFLSLATADGSFTDRRQGLHSVLEKAGLQKNLQAILDVSPSGWRMTLEPIAIRGSRLSLARARWVDVEDVSEPTTVEALVVMEVTDSGLVRDTVTFDSGDIDAAYTEIDARYLAGEAAPHAHTWLVVARAYATLNSRQIPAATPDCVTIDRRGGGVAHEGNVDSYLNATWDVAPDVTMRIETVHRLTDLGAVVTFTSSGTSQSGFSADWRGLSILTVEGELISRGEIFDEADLDAALARFDEISSPAS